MLHTMGVGHTARDIPKMQGYHLIVGHFFFFWEHARSPRIYPPPQKKNPKIIYMPVIVNLFFLVRSCLTQLIHRQKKKKDGWKLSRHTLDPMLCTVWACKWCSDYKAQNQRAHKRTQSGDGQHQDVSGQHQPHLGWGKWAVMEKKKKKKKKKQAVLLLYWRQ